MPMIVTVSRQLGAGGTQIASRVASLLQLRLVDRQILDRVADEAGVPPGIVEAVDESPAAVKERPRSAAQGGAGMT
ncbi:MAG: cytidylate kinase-like family protein, partial [Anaerolineae bacterium]